MDTRRKYLIAFDSELLFHNDRCIVEIKSWPADVPNKTIFEEMLNEFEAIFYYEHDSFVDGGNIFGEQISEEDDSDAAAFREWKERTREAGFQAFVDMLDSRWRNDHDLSCYSFLDVDDMEKLIEIMSHPSNPGWE